MTDEVVGHMYERVEIPKEVPEAPRRKPRVPPEEFLPFKPDPDLVPPMACAGEGYRIHVTGLTHDERGYPDMSAEAHDRLVRRLVDKIRLFPQEYTFYEEVSLRMRKLLWSPTAFPRGSPSAGLSLPGRLGSKPGSFGLSPRGLSPTRLSSVWPKR
jgi:2-oxoglutarate ferredoxin oxidoreductase subunit alpha